MLPDDPDAQARLFYLAILGMAIAAGAFYNYRDRLGTALQHAAIWALIFVGVTIAYGFKDNFTAQIYPDMARPLGDRTISLRRAGDGHFYARAMVNDNEIRFLVDTGATNLVLSQQDASRIGFTPESLDFNMRASTANGQVLGASVVIDRIELGRFVDTGVRAMVNGGRMEASLLGMSYLDRFTSLRVEGDTMLLSR